MPILNKLFIYTTIIKVLKVSVFCNNAPTASILLSATILFSGSTPGQVLLMLKHLSMASIKERAFFDHQKSIWHQQYYLYRTFQQFYLSVYW